MSQLVIGEAMELLSKAAASDAEDYKNSTDLEAMFGWQDTEKADELQKEHQI